jgi:hypothetical protein
MSSQKCAASWVPGNAPGNTLKRHDNINGVLMSKLNRKWVERFSGRHPAFTAIVKTLFMLEEGHCDRMYNREADGCARTWENVKPGVQADALSMFDIVESKLRSNDEMFLLARVQWERIHDKACSPEKTEAVLSFMNTEKFEKLNVTRDMLLYKQKASRSSESAEAGSKRLSRDKKPQVDKKRRIAKPAAAAAAQPVAAGVAKTAKPAAAKPAAAAVAKPAAASVAKPAAAGVAKLAAAAVATVFVKVEQFDGHYDCMICSESVRSDAEAVQCSKCNCNPMHKACVEDTVYATTCPQCGRSSMVVRLA